MWANPGKSSELDFIAVSLPAPDSRSPLLLQILILSENRCHHTIPSTRNKQIRRATGNGMEKHTCKDYFYEGIQAQSNYKNEIVLELSVPKPKVWLLLPLVEVLVPLKKIGCYNSGSGNSSCTY